MKVSTENYGDVILLTSPALVGLTESIGFKTDVFESKNGTEVRTPLKDKARQALGFDSVSIQHEVTKHFNVKWGGIRLNWAVPLFHEVQYVGSVSSEEVSCKTDIYSFYDGCLVLLKNAIEQVLVEVLAVEAGGLLLSKAINIEDAELYPVRICFISGDITTSIKHLLSRSTIGFIVIDEPEVAEATPEQFLDNDIYWFDLLLSSGSLDTTISQQQNIIDNEVGVIFQNTDWDYARYSKQYRAIIKGQSELYAYRQFLFRRRGKYRPFWLPTYEVNMRCKSTGFISSVMLIESDQYKQLGDARKHIAVRSNQTWTAHTITASALVSATTVQVTISPALNKNASSIERISYLGLHRLDADSVDLNYKGAGIVEVSVPILEIGV